MHLPYAGSNPDQEVTAMVAGRVALPRHTPFSARLTAPRTLYALVAAMLSFNVLVFPWRTAVLRGIAGPDFSVLDIRFWYAPETVLDLAARLGEQGRTLYALSEVTIDLAYPLLYGAVFGLLLRLLIRRLLPDRPRWSSLALLPIGAMVFDYAENVTLAIVLLGFPDSLPLVPLASLFTTTKWAFALASISLIVLFGLTLLARRLRRP
jgi:hypothetical protein